jgi:hypothetical protein
MSKTSNYGYEIPSRSESQAIKRRGRRLISGKSIDTQLKEGMVMLWGFKKIDAKRLNEFINNKIDTIEPISEIKEPKKKEIKKQEFNKDEIYEHKDIPFLRDE